MVGYLIICIFIVALFLYSKLLPYKSQLLGSYGKIFNFFDRIFLPLLNLLRKIAKPMRVGTNVAVDMAQVILLILLLILVRIIRF